MANLEDSIKTLKYSDLAVFGVILEWKNEGPLMLESKLMTYDDATQRLRSALEQPKVIRGCVYRVIMTDGNESLIPVEKNNGE